MNRKCDEWHSATTPQEREATQDYKGNASTLINEFLVGKRTNLTPKEIGFIEETLPTLDAAVTKGIIDEDIVVFHGFGDSTGKLTFEPGKKYQMDKFRAFE